MTRARGFSPPKTSSSDGQNQKPVTLTSAWRVIFDRREFSAAQRDDGNHDNRNYTAVILYYYLRDITTTESITIIILYRVQKY